MKRWLLHLRHNDDFESHSRDGFQNYFGKLMYVLKVSSDSDILLLRIFNNGT